ncbi:phase-specific protein [Cordyceps fumosorosea ARSEF 2679]|uniref:Phase-specific protein n=1 Tax=Cordyceps fumosorosea (strain ARSEF 2679) TaxID=1081104 RepID=A0A167PMG3_CORFA|nr:phase-specific protein [Cordyceps fumosorosea ARSEF 2679]OAA56818.1 phase-specific protein [Cordyceps fumosorosea ARSEF 2679]
MLKQLSLLALAGLSAATNVGSARVVNNCDHPVTLWSVGGDISAAHTLAKNGGKYAEQYHRDPKTGGIALKITLANNGIYTGAAQTIFAYTLDPNAVWYDLSSSMGDAFAGKRLTVTSSNTQCQGIVWADGRTPAGSQVKVCTPDSDTTLTLCAAK